VIRHFDGTNGEEIAQQARGGRIFVVEWTWLEHGIVLTKKEGDFAMWLWRMWYEYRGWKVRSRGHGLEGYVAYAPDFEIEDWNNHGPDAKVNSIALREYDKTLRRVA